MTYLASHISPPLSRLRSRTTEEFPNATPIVTLSGFAGLEIASTASHQHGSRLYPPELIPAVGLASVGWRNRLFLPTLPVVSGSNASERNNACRQDDSALGCPDQRGRIHDLESGEGENSKSLHSRLREQQVTNLPRQFHSNNWSEKTPSIILQAADMENTAGSSQCLALGMSRVLGQQSIKLLCFSSSVPSKMKRGPNGTTKCTRP